MLENKHTNTWVLIGETIPGITEARDFVQDPTCGAIHFFAGTTRDHHNGKKVTDLYYDCYEEMACKECQKLMENLLKKYEVRRIALFHKTGHAPVGETSLVVAVSAAHRQPAMDTVSELIDRLKEVVPIWKRETFEKEGTFWKEEQILSSNRKKRSI